MEVGSIKGRPKETAACERRPNIAAFEDGRMDVCMPRTASYLGKLEKGKKIDSLWSLQKERSLAEILMLAGRQVTSVVSDSVRPHRWQPTRLCCPWDSPGKNNGVGCHFLLQGMKVKSESEVAQSCPTLSDPMGCSIPGSSVHRIFQARVLEWGAHNVLK